MKYILSFLFCISQVYINATDDITKSIIANRYVTHAIEKRSFLQLNNCTIDSIGLFFFNKIKQKSIKAYSYSENSDDFKIDSKWIRDFFDEKTDTIVTDTSIIYENNKIFSIDNPNNLFTKQTVFFDEKQNTLKANVNYLAIPVKHYDPYNEDDSKSLFPIIYFSINQNKKYAKPKGNKIGTFTTDVFRNDDSLNLIKNYYNENLIDVLIDKVKSKSLEINGIGTNLNQFNSEFGFGMDSVYVTDPLIKEYKLIASPNRFYNTTRNWIRIRFVEEFFLSKKNIVSSKVIAAIFYFTFDSRPEYIKYYPVFYIKFNKTEKFDVSKYY